MSDRVAGLAKMSQRLSFAIFALPVIALTFIKFGSILSLTPFSVGQITGITEIASDEILLLVPSLIVTGAALANGLRDKSIVLTCVGGVLLNFAVTLGSLLFAALQRDEFTIAVAVRTIHFNLIVTSLISIAWLAIANRWSWDGPQPVISAQPVAVLGILLTLIGLADVRLFIDVYDCSAMD